MSEPNEILLLAAHARALLTDVASRLKPNRKVLEQSWEQAYLHATATQQKTAASERQLTLLRHLVGLFLEYLPDGHFEKYSQEVAQAGKELAELELPFPNLALAVHLYEELTIPYITREFPDQTEALRAVVANSRLYHHVLVVLTTAYYGEESRKLARQLEEARRERDRFISVMVHDVKGPLAVINGYGQMITRAISKGLPLDPKAATSIHTQVERITRMMDAVGDYSQIEAGRLELEKEPCDLVALAQTAVQEEQATTTNHRIEVKAREQPITGNWDCDRLRQVLHSLLSNALNYSPSGGEVDVEMMRQADGEARVSIVDHGVGIQAEDLPHLFEPFSRLHRKAQVRGAGLGLAVTKGIIEAHGGRIWAESTPGVGTRITFTLPLTGDEQQS